MDGFGGPRSLVYKSDNILERRDRILRVVRKMITESGIAELSVRDICARAGIAQKTLYNAFGSRESVVTVAIQQYTAEFADQVTYKFELDTLDGQLERLIKVHSRNTQLRAYTTAIMTIYNASQVSRQVRDTIRDMAAVAQRPYLERLEADDGFMPGVTADQLSAISTTTTYSILTDWCFGELEDPLLVDRICEAFLMTLVASTKGKHKKEAETFLHQLRTGGRTYTTLRKMAEVDERELRAAFVKAARAKIRDLKARGVHA